jgi:hypothetical protein
MRTKRKPQYDPNANKIQIKHVPTMPKEIIEATVEREEEKEEDNANFNPAPNDFDT